MKVAQKLTKNDSKNRVADTRQSSGQNQLAQFIDNRQEAIAQRELIDGIHNSPRMLAQRRQIEGYSQGNASTQDTAQLQLDSPPKPNNTGLPENLKSGIEALSSISMDNVRVHYNSPKPAQLNALAYSQDSEIHLAPGQEEHLPHEAWHIVQQAQGRVKPTMQMNDGSQVSDDSGLEQEADVLGAKALQMKPSANSVVRPGRSAKAFGTIQLKGVGGTKIAFEQKVNEAKKRVIEEGMSLLKGAWATARANRKVIKDRISSDMARYNKAVKDIEYQKKQPIIDQAKINEAQKTISELEQENYRRNYSQLYEAKDRADQAYQSKKDEIEEMKNQLFHDNESLAIFGAQRRLDQLKIAPPTPVQKPQISDAVHRILADPAVKVLSKAAAVLKGPKDAADEALKKNIKNNPMSGGLSQVYFDSLSSQIPDEEDLLKKTEPFKSGKLSVSDGEVTYHHVSGEVVIADIRKGNLAYTESSAPVTEKQPRQVYRKKGLEDLKTRDQSPKEYVKDSRGTMTRRYAYVEKNFYQMMEFFMVGHMTGRFQQYMMAGGERKPGVRKFTTKMIENVPLNKPPHQTEMTDTQVAVAHQMYGSLPEQRGVSLTSTPKVGVTYANTAGNFRTDKGFKLKVDLARVPDDVLFLNHYAEGGVSGMGSKDYTTKQSHKPNPYDYKYEESAAHARELFLEQIRPEWVVEIEHHEKGDFQNVGGKKTTISERDTINLLDTARKAFGGHEYEKGFEEGLKTGKEPPIKEINRTVYEKGIGTGAMVKMGYDEGVKVRGTKGFSNHMVAFKEIMEVPAIQDKMSPYHLGYAQARAGQPMVTSALEFRTLLNTEGEFKNSSTTGGTTSLVHDSDKILIKSLVPIQRGGFRTTLIAIPFTELSKTKVSHEADGGNFDITIKKQSGEEYTLSLPKAEGEGLIQSLSDAITRQSRGLQTQEMASGVGLAMAFDTTTLRLEHQTATKDSFKSKVSEIPLDSITRVEFDREDKNIQMIISHRGDAFSTILAFGEAVKVRALLIMNGLSEKIVQKIPK